MGNWSYWDRSTQPGKGERKEAGTDRFILYLCGANPHPFEDWKEVPKRIGTGMLNHTGSDQNTFYFLMGRCLRGTSLF